MEYYTEVALVSGSADVTAMTIPSQQCKMTATIAHCVEPPSSTSSSVFDLRVKRNKEIRFVNPIHFFFIETNRVFSRVFKIMFFGNGVSLKQKVQETLTFNSRKLKKHCL
jgi:hypothetical protein